MIKVVRFGKHVTMVIACRYTMNDHVGTYWSDDRRNSEILIIRNEPRSLELVFM